jgi:hypothetical protein
MVMQRLWQVMTNATFVNANAVNYTGIDLYHLGRVQIEPKVQMEHTNRLWW